ncbi:MAG: hypothetical protein MK171_00295 [Pirellulales bacterium]|nr:hypothetical protein [Pirellulales bacterium]
MTGTRASQRQKILIATAQFENCDGNKVFNRGRIDQLAGQAVAGGVEIVSFHEGCIPGYSWIQPLDKAELPAVVCLARADHSAIGEHLCQLRYVLVALRFLAATPVPCR